MTNPTWLEWAGGECPVAGDTLVRVCIVHRDGTERERERYDEASHFDSLGWWSHGNTYWRICRYRLSGDDA